MPTVDLNLAPRVLTAQEVAEVIAPQMIAYGLAHRAFTHAGIWFPPADEGGCEDVLSHIVADSFAYVQQWLGDAQVEGKARFYNSNLLKTVIETILDAAKEHFLAVEPGSPEERKMIDDISTRNVAIEAFVESARDRREAPTSGDAKQAELLVEASAAMAGIAVKNPRL